MSLLSSSSAVLPARTRSMRIALALAAAVGLAGCRADAVSSPNGTCRDAAACAPALRSLEPEVLIALDDIEDRHIPLMAAGTIRTDLQTAAVQLRVALLAADASGARRALATTYEALDQAERAGALDPMEVTSVRLALIPAGAALGLPVTGAGAL